MSYFSDRLAMTTFLANRRLIASDETWRHLQIVMTFIYAIKAIGFCLTSLEGITAGISQLVFSSESVLAWLLLEALRRHFSYMSTIVGRYNSVDTQLNAIKIHTTTPVVPKKCRRS